jgi:hypothetical protein
LKDTAEETVVPVTQAAAVEAVLVLAVQRWEIHTRKLTQVQEQLTQLPAAPLLMALAVTVEVPQ